MALVITCDCSTQLGNTGMPNCRTLAKTASALYAQRLYADDGTRNRLELATPITQATLEALVQHDDPSKRLYPINNLEEAKSPREESKKKTYESGKTIKLQPGEKNFAALIPEVEFAFLGKLEQYDCQEFGVYIGDIDAQLKGQISTDLAYLDLMEVSSGTWDPRYSEANDTDPNEVILEFQFAKSVKDSLMRLITPAGMGGADILSLEGLQDVNGVYTSPTATTVTGALTIDYGAATDFGLVEAVAFGDMIVRNTTTLTPYAVSAAVEAPAATYAIVYATAPAGDYRLELPAANGFEPIVSGTWTIV